MKKDMTQEEWNDLLALMELDWEQEDAAEEYFTSRNHYEEIGEGCYLRTVSQRDE